VVERVLREFLKCGLLEHGFARLWCPECRRSTRCGRKMQMIAFLTDQLSIKRILDHLGLSEPPQDRPPPAREILRVAEHGEIRP